MTSHAPPRRDDVLRILAERREELAREHRVRSLSLFGSVARDEGGPDSDVDVLVEFQPGASLLTMGGLQQYLVELFGREVDLVDRAAIKRQLRERILAEEVPVLDTAPDGALTVVATDGWPARTCEHRDRGWTTPTRNWKMWIEDMLEAIEKIERYTAGMDFEAFAANDMAADAVTRNVAIIGEAARRVPPEVQAGYPAVDWTKMWGMRNVLIYDCPGVNLEVVWRVVRQHIPPLVPILREILEREP